MTPAARLSAAIDILEAILSGEAADKVLTNWGRRNRYAGSKDRAAIRDTVYDVLRCKASYGATISADPRGLVIAHLLAQDIAPETVFTGEGYAPSALTEAETAAIAAPKVPQGATAGDLPDWMPAKIARTFPDWEAVGQALQSRAPLDLRVNLSRISRDSAADMLAGEGVGAEPVEGVETALRVTKNPRRLSQTRAYLDGFVEVQDVASQKAVALLSPKRGQSALDYCAGGGGKALAIADYTLAPVVAHDIAPARMMDIPERAARADVRIDLADKPALTGQQFDLVFVDAPCSGSGTWRRTPEAKWAFTQQDLADITRVQAQVLEEASAYVAQGGRLLYATCSIFKDENRDVVEAFLGAHDNWRLEEVMELSPLDGSDGFFAAVLTSDQY